MKRRTHTALLLTAALMLGGTLSLSASAQEITVDASNSFTFSRSDFTTADTTDGIFLTALPSPALATVYFGNRALHPGDALPTSALDQLTLSSNCVTEQEVSIGYCTVSEGSVTGVQEMTLSILPKKDLPPTAEDSSLETYKNIANSGTLQAADPEGKSLTYQVVEQPKRGTVELQPDGSFTYTPNKNKVGKDAFTFTATDPGGNTSEPAKVSIEILKPSQAMAYTDMEGDPDAFAAMWLQEAGLFSGTTVGGNFCFCPDEPVSRGEFLVMVMKLVDAEADETGLASGFSDEETTPVWMQPYIVSALSNGMITGVSSEAGVVFRPEASLTKAEAAVMLQNVLNLPNPTTRSVFEESEDDAVPVWAVDAAAAVSAAGLPLDLSAQADAITRRDTAKLLYAVAQLMKGETLETFYWVQ